MLILLRRCLVPLTAFALLAGGSTLPAAAVEPAPGATAQAASVAAKPKVVKPQALVRVSTPPGIPLNVTIRGSQSKVLVKPASGTSASWKVLLKPGRYSVAAAPVVVGGKRYLSTVSPTILTVPKAVKGKKYRVPNVTVTTREVKVTTIVEAAQITPTSVDVRWLVPSGVGFNVVRRTGNLPATTPSGGTVVATSGPRVTDRSVTPGTVYTYALLLRTGSTWRLGSQVVVGTPEADAPPSSAADAPYAVAPTAVRVAPGDRDVVGLISGQPWVTLASTRATPILGSGFTLPPSTLFPDGYLGRVAEISADGRRVRLEQGGLPDVFSYLDLDVSLSGPAQPLQFETNASRARAMLAQRAEATGQAVSRDCERESSLDINFNGPTLTPGGHVRHKIKSTWGVPNSVEFDLRGTLTVAASMDITATASIACQFAIKPFEKTALVGGVPVAFSFQPTFDVSLVGKASAEGLGGSFTAGAWAKGSIGLSNRYEQGPVNEIQVNHPSIKFDAEATLRLGGAVSLGFGAVTPGGRASAGAVLGLQGDLDIFKLSGKAVVADPTAGACAVVETTSRAALSFGLRFWAGPFEKELKTPEFINKTLRWSEPQYFPKGCEVVTKDGDVLISLAWRSPADLDLHVFEPSGQEIWYGNRNSATGGYLDTDANAACGERLFTPQENVTWPTGRSPNGEYRIQVETFDTCNSDLRWTLVVKVDGRTVLSQAGTGTSPVYTVRRGVAGAAVSVEPAA